jgi:tripartite-type tricarboxylate transporter receptor subunit TctC
MTFAPLHAALLSACLAFAALGSNTAQAQPYPSKPIRIVVSFGPGGSADLTARAFGQFIEQQTRQSVVIDNKPGANGIIGTELVKSSPPDGYTLQLITNTTHAANLSLYKKVPYDPVRDFDYIGLFGTFGSVATVLPGQGISNVADLVAYSRAHPGKTFYGYYNSASQMAAELFRSATGADLTGVPYKAIGNALTDLMGKNLQVVFLEYPPAAAQIEGGKLIGLAVTGATRHKPWPNIPAMAETYPGFEMSAYLGLAAPAGTPPAVLDTLNALVVRSIQDPAMRAQYEKLGMALKPMNRTEFRNFAALEVTRWRDFVKTAGIQPE